VGSTRVARCAGIRHATYAAVRFARLDLTDPCGFTYSSTDADVVPPIARVVPLQ
jgi:hypothetical protein